MKTVSFTPSFSLGTLIELKSENRFNGLWLRSWARPRNTMNRSNGFRANSPTVPKLKLGVNETP